MPAVQSTSAKRISLILRLLLPFLILLLFTGDLLRSYFSFDDFMNLHLYVEAGWQQCQGLLVFWSSHYYRPFGGLVYLTLYRLFGLHALAFKWLVLLLLLLNLCLATLLARRLLHSTTLACVVALLIAYHPAESQLYYSFGTIYELTCFLFMFGAMIVYIGKRESGTHLGPGLILVVAALQILALDAKEMAVAVPVLLALYEAFVSPDARKRMYSWRAAFSPVLLGLIVAIYIHGKSSGNSSLTISSLYRPVYSLHKYVQSMSHYLNQLFYSDNLFHNNRTFLFLLAGVVLGLSLRSRLLLFGWLWTLVCFLPVNFIPDRDGFVWYIPIFGFALALVSLCDKLYQRFAPGVSQMHLLNPSRAPFFAFLAVILLGIGIHAKPKATFLQTHQLVLDKQVAADLERETPHPLPHARLLFVTDPFPVESWTAEFMPALQRHDLSLSAARGRLNYFAMAPSVLPSYTEIYDYQQPHLIRLTAGEMQSRLSALRREHGFIEPLEGVDFDPNGSSWTRRIFKLRASCPAALPQCRVIAAIVLPHESYPGIHLHSMKIQLDSQPEQTASLTTDIGANYVPTELAGSGAEHTLTYQFDATVPQAQHPLDPRELAVILRGARIEL